RRHHQAQQIPAVLETRLIHVLRLSGRFEQWGLEEIIPDRGAFFAFLQERWQGFLDRLGGSSASAMNAAGMKNRGPVDLPFDHSDVRVYIDTLFLEGSLHPVAHPSAGALATQWVGIGISVDPASDRQRRLEGLIESVDGAVPAQDAKHLDWLTFAQR